MRIFYLTGKKIVKQNRVKCCKILLNVGCVVAPPPSYATHWTSSSVPRHYSMFHSRAIIYYCRVSVCSPLILIACWTPRWQLLFNFSSPFFIFYNNYIIIFIILQVHMDRILPFRDFYLAYVRPSFPIKKVHMGCGRFHGF